MVACAAKTCVLKSAAQARGWGLTVISNYKGVGTYSCTASSFFNGANGKEGGECIVEYLSSRLNKSRLLLD